jgi:dihydroxy-acid dehydratase
MHFGCARALWPRMSCACMQEGGPLALVQDGDVVSIDAEKRTMDMAVGDDELARRRAAWTAPALKATQGTLYKYIKSVSNASSGCVTDA